MRAYKTNLSEAPVTTSSSSATANTAKSFEKRLTQRMVPKRIVPIFGSDLMKVFADRRDIIHPPMPAQIGYQQFLGDFRDTIVSAKARLSDMSETESRRKSSPDDWSPAEVLGHLIDSAANNHQRFVRAQFTDDLVFSGYEQERWVSSQKYS